jgi:hypothetical protein
MAEEEIPRPHGLTDDEAQFARIIVSGRAATPTHAAEMAGRGGKNGRMWACRAIKRKRVQVYMEALRGRALVLAKAQGPVVVPDRMEPIIIPAGYSPIATTADVMRKLTRVLHADIGHAFKEGPDGEIQLSLKQLIERGMTDLIDEVHVTTGKGIRIKFARKMDAINTLVRVLGMEEASEADRAKERAAVAAALASLPPDVLAILAKTSLGPSSQPEVPVGDAAGEPG